MSADVKPRCSRLRHLGHYLLSLISVFALAACLAGARAQVAVVTHHNDTYRTGANTAEIALTYASVPASFGLLGTVALDAKSTTQPLVVPNITVSGDPNPGTHDVVYVATANNSVYAIDPVHQTVLAKTNLGTPVNSPLHCGSTNVGITGTPVIDTSLNAIFVMAYVQTANGPQYFLHSLSLTTLADNVAPITVAGTVLLSDHKSTANFDATYQLERAALVEANGTIYAGFASFCDFGTTHSRGWVLGWQASTLAPAALPTGATQSYVTVNRVTSYLLGSIWMSGAGPAYDPVYGGVYFVTGNSDSKTYDGTHSIQESVIRFSVVKNVPLSVFTPYQESTWDSKDLDFGAGGVLLIPPTSTRTTLAAAAGKSGTLYLSKGSALGGFTKGGPDNVLDQESIGGCYCSASFYNDASGPTVVTSGGSTVQLWSLVTSPKTALQPGLSATIDPTPQDPGFFTSISSSGQSNPIVWAVGRPAANTHIVTLYAFQADAPSGSTSLPLLYRGSAGTWPYGGNATLVPTVANGYVYVATNQLAIFGLTQGAVATAKLLPASATENIAKPEGIIGVVTKVELNGFTLRTASGVLHVDGHKAVLLDRAPTVSIGQHLVVQGRHEAGGVVIATEWQRLKEDDRF